MNLNGDTLIVYHRIDRLYLGPLKVKDVDTEEDKILTDDGWYKRSDINITKENN